MQPFVNPRSRDHPLWLALQRELERRPESEALLVVGGDGTVHQAVNRHPGRPLLIVPTGSGNDIARSLHIPRDAARLADSLANPPRCVDVLRLSFPDGRVVLAVGSVTIGFASHATALAERLRGRLPTRLLYLGALLAGLASWRNRRLQLDCDGFAFFGSVLNCTLANLRHYGGGMIASPRANGFDGEIACVAMQLSWLGALRHLRKTYSGDWDSLVGIKQWKARQIRVTAPFPLPVQADGELLGTTPFECTILPGALEVFLESRGEHDEKQREP